MKYLINYADDHYREAQKYCTKMAYKRAGVDKVIEYSPKLIEKGIVDLCPEGIYGDDRKAKRYGLWRPYILKRTLEDMQEGDYLCYCDAGGYFIRDISPIIKDMELKGQDIRVFALPLIERQWTKRDVFIYLEADHREFTDSNQILSTFIFVKKTYNSMLFIEEFYNLTYEAPFLFTDSDNILGKNNYPEFIENRHNQSVFSILCKKNHIIPEPDISEYGLHPKLYSFTPGVIYKPFCSLKEMPYYISHRRNKVTLLVHFGNILRVCLPAHLFLLVLKVIIFLHNIYKGNLWNKKKDL